MTAPSCMPKLTLRRLTLVPTGRAGVALGPASCVEEHTPVRNARTFIIIAFEGKPQLVILWRAVLNSQV